MKLSDTQRVILSAAAQHEAGLAKAPKALPAAARNAVFRSLLKNNLLTEIEAPRQHAGLGWRQDDAGAWIAARITDEGLRAIGLDPNEGDAVADTAPTDAPGSKPEDTPAPVAEAAPDASGAPDTAARAENLALLHQTLAPPAPTRGATLRQAAQAVIDTWDDQADRGALAGPVETLRALLAGKPARVAREPGAPRKPREGTKREQVLGLLRRPEGATVAKIAEATGWAPHTVRGFFAGLKKKGTEIAVLERVRQVGPNKDGAKESYTVYRVAEAG